METTDSEDDEKHHLDKRKWNSLRGLRRCCSEAQSDDDDNDDVSSTNSDEMTSTNHNSTSSCSSCPIAGAFVDAATSIAVKLFVDAPNLVRGTRVKQPTTIFWIVDPEPPHRAVYR